MIMFLLSPEYQFIPFPHEPENRISKSQPIFPYYHSNDNNSAGTISTARKNSTFSNDYVQHETIPLFPTTMYSTKIFHFFPTTTYSTKIFRRLRTSRKNSTFSDDYVQHEKIPLFPTTASSMKTFQSFRRPQRENVPLSPTIMPLMEKLLLSRRQ